MGFFRQHDSSLFPQACSPRDGTRIVVAAFALILAPLSPAADPGGPVSSRTGQTAGEHPRLGLDEILGFPQPVIGQNFVVLPLPARTHRLPRRLPAEAHGPNARVDWFNFQRSFPSKSIPVGARQRALAQAEKIAEVHGRFKASGSSLWSLRGPAGFDSNVPTATTWGRMSGRVRALAIDPNNADRLLLGTATGGAWLTTNGGTSWTPLTDNQPSLAVGAVAIDPSNSNTFYVGTGEGNGTYYSAGILKSTNAGASWSVLGASIFNRGAISGIAVSPANSNLLVVCARDGKTLGGEQVGTAVRGIYRSTDGGQSFQQTSNGRCTDLAVVPSNFNTMYYSATGLGASSGLYHLNQ